MVTPGAGAVVVVPFPFSDLSQTKRCPAVVLADAGWDDWILCQITSNPYGNHRAIMRISTSFATGSLPVTSQARTGKLFTANTDLMITWDGTLKPDSFKQIIEAVVTILRPGTTV